MLHPDTELGVVSADIGLGVFAKAFIPKGTIVYIKDPLEIEISEEDPRLQDPGVLSIIERYSYREPGGTRVLSWDQAKYMNHSCEPNTISTGYGFEIALRNIRKGEEITDEYGLLNIEANMPCGCGVTSCRKWVRQDDVERHGKNWDAKVLGALACYTRVPQPLAYLLDSTTLRRLQNFLATGDDFISVNHLRFYPRQNGHGREADPGAVIGGLKMAPGIS